MTDNQIAERANEHAADTAQHYDLFEFIQGQADFREGIPHEDKNESYTAGYNTEYTAQQTIEGQTRAMQ